MTCETPGCCGDGVCETCTCCDRGHCSNEHLVVGGSIHAPGNEAAWQNVGHVGADWPRVARDTDEAVTDLALHGEVWVAPPGTIVTKGDLVAMTADERPWYVQETADGGRLVIFPGTGPDPHAHVEHLPPTYQQQPHAYVDGIAATALQYHAQSNLYMRGVEDRARRYIRGTDWEVPGPAAPYWNGPTTFEYTVEIDQRSQAFELLFFGMTRAQHDLLHRLNTTWKYRIDPGTPESVRRYLGGQPERRLTPVIVTVDGRDIEALAEPGPGATTFYPAHPKGKA